MGAPISSPISTVKIAQDFFNNFRFSVVNPNLVINNVSYNSLVKINLKVSINGINTVVNDYLNYTYDDEFITFTGKLPVTVKKDNILNEIWTMDFTLASPGENCDETDLEDEDGIPPTFHFNSNGTITFDSHMDGIAGVQDLNNPNYYTNTYELNNGILKIIVFNFANVYGINEQMKTETTLTYDPITNRYLGNYTWKIWENGVLLTTCSNTLKIHK